MCEKEYVPMIKASMNWQEAEGKIIRHSVYEEKTGRYSHSPRTHYHAEAYYKYTAGGRSYEGRRICFYHSNCGTGTSKEDALTLLKNYPVNTAAAVYYNPESPEMSTLRRGTPRLLKKISHEISQSWIYGIALIILSGLTFLVTVKTAKEFRD